MGTPGTGTRMKTIGLPVKFSSTPGGINGPAPVCGEHTRDLLAEHGYSEAEIDALLAEKACVSRN